MRPKLVTRLKEEWNNLDPVDPLRGLISDAIDALAEQPAQVPVTDNTYGYAKSLAEAIFKQHFASDKHYASGQIVWGVNDTVIGILTQIDNMVADMVRRPAQQQEPVAIKWTLDGDKTCGYNNWLGETPFGRILITWKGWKEYHDACVDEFPGDFNAYGSPDEVKKMCEAEFAKRSGYTSPQPSKPWVGLTSEERDAILNREFKQWWSRHDAVCRAIEAKLKEKNT